jgi:hypothetical protein
MTGNDAFLKSLNDFARFPSNLVYPNTYEHTLEDHVARLDKQENDLCSTEEKSDVELWEFGVQASGESSEQSVPERCRS